MNSGKPKCSVPGCENDAVYRVMLYDFYTHNGSLFVEQDFTCPHICEKHAIENETQAKGERRPRGMVYYPHTNTQSGQGFTIYLPLDGDTTN